MTIGKSDLKIPSSEEVVQRETDNSKRMSNPLYRPNRRITADEFATIELSDLISFMHKTMTEKAGIGIAANQVGKNLQIFMIEAKPDNIRYKVFGAVPYTVFINPKILQASTETRNFWHGCLSAVGEKRGNVATYDWIEVEAQKPDGSPFTTRLAGLAAIIFQHEFRHMLGGLYLDRAETFLSKDEIDLKMASKEIKVFELNDKTLPHLIGDYQIGESLEEYYARKKLASFL
jgi:peptide deformylase